MSTVVERVAAAKNAQEGMLVLADALDQIIELLGQPPTFVNDSWSAWDDTPGTIVEVPGSAVEVEYHEGETLIDLKPVSAEKQEKRFAFATEVLKLNELLPELGPSALFAYARGGPLWLYHGDRQLFMSYGEGVRRAMVIDLAEEDDAEAGQLAADVLKDPNPGESWVEAAERINGSVPD